MNNPIIATGRSNTADDISRFSHFEKKLLHMYVPASVLIGQDYICLHFFGDCTPYVNIRSDVADSNILSIILPELRMPLYALLHRAKHESATVCDSFKNFENSSGKNDSDALHIVVRPLLLEDLGEHGFFIHFQPCRTGGDAITAIDKYSAQVTDDQHNLRIAYTALRNSEQRFRDLVESSTQGILIHHDFKPLFVNQALIHIFGYGSADEFLTLTSIIECYTTSEHERLRDYYQARLRGEGAPVVYETEALRKDGTPITLLHSVGMIRWDTRPAVHLLVVDITQRKQVEQALKQQANYDALTMLPNRILFMDRLRQSIHQADRNRESLHVLFIDLDGFKSINDAFGHDVGDELLRQAALRLKHCVRESDTIARFGGDEFVLMLTGTEEPGSVIRVIDEILAQLHHPFVLHDNTHRLSVSIGVAVYPDDTRDMHTLIRYADTAMYRTKENGRNGYTFFQPGMNARAVERTRLKQALSHAVEHEQLTLHYQPIIDIRAHRVVGAEALVRWKHPSGDVLNPDRFIPVAEESGQIVPLGQWILQQALISVERWRHALHTDFYVAVNLSLRQLYEDSFFKLIQALSEENIARLAFEITGSIFLKKHRNVLDAIALLRDKGGKIHIDDFGSGHYSLKYLQTLPVDTIKIGQDFVRGEETIVKPNDAFIEAILAIARGIGADVIAEGVETRGQFEFLQQKSCRYMQGFYFSKPLPAQAFEQFVDNWKPTFERSLPKTVR